MWALPTLLLDALLLLAPLTNACNVYLYSDNDTGSDLNKFLFSLASACLLVRVMGLGISQLAAASTWHMSILSASLSLCTGLVIVANFYGRSLRLFEASLLLSVVSSVAGHARTDGVRRVGACVLLCAYGIGVAIADSTTVLVSVGSFFEFVVCAAAMLLLMLGTSSESSVVVRCEKSTWDLPIRTGYERGRTTVRLNTDLVGVLGHIGYILWWVPPLCRMASAQNELVDPVWFRYVFDVCACMPSLLLLAFTAVSVTCQALLLAATCMRT